MRVFRPARTTGQPGSVIRDPQAHSDPVRAADIDWANGKLPRGINCVPTHTVGRANERRAYSRARLSLPLIVERVAGQRHPQQPSLKTTNISSSGLFFLSPTQIDAGTPIEVEVQLIRQPVARAIVYMNATAHVVRSEVTDMQGWYGVAAAFDDISYRREENLLDL